MRRSISVLVLCCITIWGSAQSKLIIKVSEFRDSKVYKERLRLLANSWTVHSIVYKKNHRNYKCKKYMIKKYYKEWDAEVLKSKTKSARTKRFKNELPLKLFDSLVVIAKHIEVPKSLVVTHTSHHYLHYFVSFVDGVDTVELHKTKPFDSTTRWDVSRNGDYIGSFVNLNFDLIIYDLLPKKFVARERLLALPEKLSELEKYIEHKRNSIKRGG